MLQSGTKRAWVFGTSAVISIVLAGVGLAVAGTPSRRPPGPRPADSLSRDAARPPGFSVDHPPAGALGPLIDFARCMRRHGVQMPDPTHWAGHAGRLTLYLPPQDRRTRSAYRACNHDRVLAKHKGGPH